MINPLTYSRAARKRLKELDRKISGAGIKARKTVKKHTFWRKIKAMLLRMERIETDPRCVYRKRLMQDTNYFNNL